MYRHHQINCEVLSSTLGIVSLCALCDTRDTFLLLVMDAFMSDPDAFASVFGMPEQWGLISFDEQVEREKNFWDALCQLQADRAYCYA